MTSKQTYVRDALIMNAEGCSETDAEGRIWRSVYLGNARPMGFTPRVFAGRLGKPRKAWRVQITRRRLFRPRANAAMTLPRSRAAAHVKGLRKVTGFPLLLEL
jgi:hypothetical protein